MSKPITLLLIRHGIAEAPQPGLSDADRALTSEGREKTLAAMNGLVARGFKPHAAFTSPYRRAMETTGCLVEACGTIFPITPWDGLVPEASPSLAEAWLRGELAEADPGYCVAMVSHLPFLPILVQHLTGRVIDCRKASCTILRYSNGTFTFVEHLQPRTLRG